MDRQLTLISESETLLQLVGDFARGLGCAIERENARGELRVEWSETDDALLELLDYIALSATKAGVDFAEPLCRLRYRRGGAPAEVTLDLRIADFRLARAGSDNASAERGSP